jgi:hypothetical protein
MTTPEPQPELEASDLGRFEPAPCDLGISDDPEVTWSDLLSGQIARELTEAAGLGHDYDGAELRSGTPEYEALYAEYQAWAAQPEPCDRPVPYTLTPEAEAELADEWDCADSNAYQARVEAGLEPEAEL